MSFELHQVFDSCIWVTAKDKQTNKETSKRNWSSKRDGFYFSIPLLLESLISRCTTLCCVPVSTWKFRRSFSVHLQFIRNFFRGFTIEQIFFSLRPFCFVHIDLSLLSTESMLSITLLTLIWFRRNGDFRIAVVLAVYYFPCSSVFPPILLTCSPTQDMSIRYLLYCLDCDPRFIEQTYVICRLRWLLGLFLRTISYFTTVSPWRSSVADIRARSTVVKWNKHLSSRKVESQIYRSLQW